MPELKRAFRIIGLGEKEIAVMLVLLEGGTMYAAAVAREAKLNRTTTYGILKELAAKGLVSSERKHGAARYQSIAPELLPTYIERRGNELLATKQEVAKLVPQIKLLRSKGNILPKVEFFEGKEGMLQFFIGKLENNKGKMLFEFTGMDAGYETLGMPFIENYLKKRVSMGIRSQYIAPETLFAKKQAEYDEKLLREVKFIPAQYSMDTEISIYDDKVSIVSFSKDNPVAILIEDENIAKTMKKIFDYVRSTAK